MDLGRTIAVLGLISSVVCAERLRADDAAPMTTGAGVPRWGDDSEYVRLALDWREVRDRQFLAGMLALPQDRRRDQRRSLDLTPLAEMAIGYVRGFGIPLEEHRDADGKRPIAVSAQFAVAENMPNVQFHLGDRAADPIGAFYPPERGFRFSIAYPMRSFSLRVEGGDDSEFGSLAVAGMSWVHPNRRMAAGLGLPMRLRNSDGDFGAIFQFRFNFGHAPPPAGER